MNLKIKKLCFQYFYAFIKKDFYKTISSGNQI